MSATPALIRRLSEVHYAFLGLWPGFARREVGGGVLIGNRLIPMAFRNHATLVRAADDQVPDLLEGAEEFFAAMGMQPAFQLEPGTTPADLGARLEAAGYARQAEETWMICEPEAAVPVPANPAVTVEVLNGGSPAASVDGYVDCFTTSFGTPRAAVADYGVSLRGVLDTPGTVHYLARLAGEPAGCMSLFADAEGYGCVYNVGTYAAFRGQAIATTLLHQLTADAQRLGMRTLFLQTVHHGPAQPLYERFGFRTRFLRTWYAPGAPGGIWDRR